MNVYEKIGAVAELILAAAFWGFGFIAVIWVLPVLNFSELTWLRFALAGSIGLFFLFKMSSSARREIFALSFWPAALLAALLFFQSWGLKYTTATKSGFITTLYVVFVPILESVIQRRRLAPAMWGCVVLALAGTALIVGLNFTEVNIGDWLTLLCAFFAAGQIYLLGVVSPRVQRPFAFNISQSIWGTIFLTPMVLNSEYWRNPEKVFAWPLTAWIGMGSLAFGSTVIAFYLQVRAQAKLSPTVSSLLFLLESPFALIFSMLLLNEKLGMRESVGAMMIFVAAVVASVLESAKKD